MRIDRTGRALPALRWRLAFFDLYPLNILPWDRARAILEDIATHLQGDYGIRRYLGDSYWFPDYKKNVSPRERTADVSDNMGKRDANVKLGEEAQWCIFDSIISVIYGERYLELEGKRNLELEGKRNLELTGKRKHAPDEAAWLLQRQTEYFNRAVGTVDQ